MTIHTLSQTRKIQIENHRKIIKNQISNENLEIGMSGFMRNPEISGKKRKNFHESLNVKAKILKFHPPSTQYYVEYESMQKGIKHKWISNCELFTNTKPEIKELPDFIDRGKITFLKNLLELNTTNY